MPHPICHLARLVLGGLLLAGGGPLSWGQDAYPLSESFRPGTRTRVELRTELTGRLSLPAAKKGEPGRTVSLNGQGTLVYDETPLAADGDAQAVLRLYRVVEFRRTIADQQQEAQLRPEVRRLVVLRSAEGNKSPFSPDGPLTWNEIDTIRTDVFSPSLVPGLLPQQPVRVGDTWPVTAAAVRDLTDMDKLNGGGFTMKLVGVVQVGGQPQARLALSGTVSGLDENGPCRHTLVGSAYFDLPARRLSYLSIRGTHELLDSAGKVAGAIEGRFTLTRQPSTAAELAPEMIQAVSATPTPENSLLLYDNPDLGVVFLYPRRWRVGAVQGRQLTLDGPNNAGILLTVEPAARLPTVEAYQRESLEFLRQQRGNPTLRQPPYRWQGMERFAIDAELGGEQVRMEYAVRPGRTGGVTLAARLPLADAAPLKGDLDRLLRSLECKK